MRTLPVHCRTIQVSTATGELRRIIVSGITKARLLWLFRNFSILDFSVLSKEQQQLIARVWYAAPSGKPNGAGFDLIGSIEGFSPRLCQPSHASIIASSPRKPGAGPRRIRSRMRSKLGRSGSWTSLGVLVLVCAIYLRPVYFKPKLSGLKPPVPNSRVAPQRSANAPALAASQASQLGTLPRIPSEAAPSMASVGAPAPENLVSPPIHLPDAMARQESVGIVRPPHPQTAPVSKAPPQVLIRVRVDGQGRSQSFDVMQGNRKQVPAAMAAARRWNFQPCSGPASCEHVLKFTDYGDASILQSID